MPFGLGSAVVYGASIVVQHRAAQEHADDTGSASAAGLLRLVRSPVWLLAIVGDFVGFLLQPVALSTGPVVVIQPLVVLMLPVSVFVSALLGWHRPRRGDYLGVVLAVAGLAAFLGLIGPPAHGHGVYRVLAMTIAISLAAGFLLRFAVVGRDRSLRGATYGTRRGRAVGAPSRRWSTPRRTCCTTMACTGWRSVRAGWCRSPGRPGWLRWHRPHPDVLPDRHARRYPPATLSADPFAAVSWAR